MIAESDAAVVETNHYGDAIKSEHFEPSSTTTVEDAPDVARRTKGRVKNAEGGIALWRGVEVR